MLKSLDNTHPNCFFFKFQLFTFSETDTSKTPLYLIDPTNFDDDNVYILSLNENGVSKNHGLQLKYTIDASSVTEEEFSNFMSYLKNESLFVHIYDNETRFKYGVIRIPLELFIRSDSESSVQHTKEYDIVESLENLIADEGFVDEIKGKLQGKLVLTVSNVGRLAESQNNKFVKAKQKYENAAKKKVEGPTQSLFEQYNFLSSLKEPESETLEKYSNDELREYCRSKMQSIADYRKKEKTNIILQQVEDLMTSHKVIYASFGELCFFELPFKNLYSKDHAFTVEIEQKNSALTAVVEDDERVYLSEYHQSWNCIQLPSQGNFAYRFSLASQSLTRIPFKYQSFSELSEDSEEIRVLVKNSKGAIQQILKIRVVPRKFVTNQNFEFYHPVESTTGRIPFKKKIRYSLSDFGHTNTSVDKVFVKSCGNVSASISAYGNVSNLLLLFNFSLEFFNHEH